MLNLQQFIEITPCPPDCKCSSASIGQNICAVNEC